jgi:hypothetical protein
LQETVRESLFAPLLAFLCLGWAGVVYAIESAPPSGEPPENGGSSLAVAGEIALLRKHWPPRCTELEEARKILEARRCWSSAAGELDRYASIDHPVADGVDDLRMDWLWRAARLSLQEPETQRPAADADSCAFGLSGDDERCPEAAPEAPETKPAKLRKKKLVSGSKKKAAARKKTVAGPVAKKKVVAIPAASEKNTAQKTSMKERLISLVGKAKRKKPPQTAALPPVPKITINYAPIYPHR